MIDAITTQQNKRLQLPLGFFDKTGEELRRQRIVEGIFRAEGASKGYAEIETPILENAEALPKELFCCWKRQGFIRLNLPDYNAQLCTIRSAQVILRPEGTIPVCRWLATKIANGDSALPVKLIYSIDCYRNEPVEELTNHKRRQFNQLGVEFIGESSSQADEEVIQYAYAVMRGVGIAKENIRIRLSNIELFKRLCNDSEFTQRRQYTLQEKIDGFSKARALGKANELSLPELRSLNSGLKSRWENLLTTYNARESTVEKIDPCLAQTLRNLRRVPIVVDTSVVRGFSYYTGPVFQIDVRKNGNWVAEIGGGGRYDELIGQNLKTFGMNLKIPATGFAFGTERLVQSSNLPAGKYKIEMSI